MKHILIIAIIYCGLLISCYKPYDTSIEANDTILVVDGLITTDFASYRISLRYALPFNSKLVEPRVNSAFVTVTDDLGNTYVFNEKSSGNYVSDSLIFTAKQGRTYILSIETTDGEKFISGPQKIEPAFSVDSVYAELEFQQTLTRFNQIVKTVRGTNILIDVKSYADSLPRFRFLSKMVKQYTYSRYIPPPDIDPPLYLFYCWQTENSNTDINLTKNEYSGNSFNLSRHSVYFLDEQVFIDAFVYNLGPKQSDQSYKGIPTTSRQTFSVSNRILYLDQYSLNNEAYTYYEKMDELLRSEGKLFDPIVSQLEGNVKCVTNPDRKVFGFFESSSVSHSVYSISYRNQSNKYTIISRPYIVPVSTNGCLINKTPPFWII
jgi:hypothetical protein